MGAESELSISYATLMSEVAAFLGYGSDSTAWSANQKAELDRYVQSGLRRFYYPPATEGAETGYSWSFLHPVTTLTTAADDGAQDLPAGCGRVLGGFFFDESVYRRSIVQVGEQQYQELISRTESTGAPTCARVRVKDKVPGTGQRLEVAWWPIPDAAYVLTYRYEAYAGKLSDDNPYPLGGMRHAELLIASCLSVAEQRANDERGIQTAEFERLLATAIEHDRRLGAQHFGHMGGFDDGATVPRHGDTGGTYPITYNGVDVDA